MGYDTKIQENGKGVSEGQKQRILFARAIYSHPEYLLLDELTSALDSNNELSIIETIKSCHIILLHCWLPIAYPQSNAPI